MDTSPNNGLIQYEQLAVINQFLSQENLEDVDLGSDEIDFYISVANYVSNALEAKAAVLWVPDGDEISVAESFGPVFDYVDQEGEEFACHVDLAFTAMEQSACSIFSKEAFLRELGVHFKPEQLVIGDRTQLFIPFLRKAEAVCVLALFVDPEVCPISIAELIIITQRIELLISRRDEHEVALTQQLIETENRRHERFKLLQENVSRNLDVKKNAFDVVNELQSYLGTGRVTLCSFRGTSCKVTGVSGQAVFNKRSPILKHVKALSQLAGRSRNEIYVPDDLEKLPKSIQRQFEKYFETADTRSIALLPLIKQKEPSVDPNDMAAVIRDRDAKPGKVVGVIAVEGLDRILDRETLGPTWKQCKNTVVHSVANSHQYSSFFLMPVWRRLGQFADLFRGHHRNKAILATLCLLMLMAFLTFYQSEFRVSCSGYIQPSERAQIFAEVDGVVSEIVVKDGDMVKKDQVIVRLTNPEIEAKYIEVEGELAATSATLKTLMRQRNINTYQKRTDREKEEYKEERSRMIQEASTLEAKMDSLKRRLALLELQRSKLEVRSPCDGTVMTWNVKNRLTKRPVKSGDLLMMVAEPDGDWELELRVPDRRAGYVLTAWEEKPEEKEQLVTYCIASNPTEKHQAKLREIASRADVDEKKGNVVRAFADIATSADSPIAKPIAKPGTEILAHIHVGQRSIGYCKVYEFLDWTKRSWFKYVN